MASTTTVELDPLEAGKVPQNGDGSPLTTQPFIAGVDRHAGDAESPQEPTPEDGTAGNPDRRESNSSILSSMSTKWEDTKYLFKKLAFLVAILTFFATVTGIASSILQFVQSSSNQSSTLCSLNTSQILEMQEVLKAKQPNLKNVTKEIHELLNLGKDTVENERKLLQKEKELLKDRQVLFQEVLDKMVKDFQACQAELKNLDVLIPVCEDVSASMQSKLNLTGGAFNPGIGLIERSPSIGVVTRTTLWGFAGGVYLVFAVLLLFTAAFIITFAHRHWKKIFEYLRQPGSTRDEEPEMAEKLPIAETRNLRPESPAPIQQGPLRPGLQIEREGIKGLSKGDVWKSATSGDKNSLKFYLDIKMININEVHPRLGTPLQAAAQGGQADLIQFLLERKADPNISGGRFHTPLQAAAYARSKRAVAMLLHAGAEINTTGGICGSAILAAAERGSFEVVQHLVDKGADINHLGGRYRSVLQAAAFAGNVEMIEYLLDRNADINAQGGEYGSALQAAAIDGKRNIIELLLEHKADVHCNAGNHGTALQIACRNGHPVAAEMLVNCGADVNVRDSSRRTTLHYAAKSGYLSLVELLLQKGIDPNAQDDDLFSGLHYAALNGHDAVVSVLLKYGANPSIMDKFQSQPLFRASELGYTKVVQLLVAAGVDVSAADSYGCAALHCPSETDDVSVQEILIRHGANVNCRSSSGATPLHRATDVGNIPNVKILLANGANVNIVDNDQNTALSKAIQRDQDKIAKLLLAQPGIDINVSSGVAIQEAIYRGKIDLIDTMLAMKSININVQGGQYGSLVGAAACNGSPVILQKLLDMNANPNIQGGEYGVPVQAAAFLGHIQTLRLLLDNGANVNTPGGRYGCVYRAVRMSKAVEVRRREVSRLLEGTGMVNIPRTVHREYERWILTPGGWTWLPTPGRDQSYVTIEPRQDRITDDLSDDET